MDVQNVYSFEQRSTVAFDASRGNRVIIANRREPNIFWSNLNDSSVSRSIIDLVSVKTWFHQCVQQTLCCLCNCLSRDHSDHSFRTSSDRKPTWSRQHLVTKQQLEGANFDSGPFVSNEIISSKYTLLNFLPKNLFEQFRRLANFYFLTSALIQIIIPFSPIGPTTSLLPLLFVVSTTAIKQAYEDYLRHKLDRDVNNRLCSVLKNKKLQRVRSKDIKVGDIVFVKNNEELPCDMVLLASSSGALTARPRMGPYSPSLAPAGGDRCYITTANLDGETSLKSRTCFAIRQQIGSIREVDNTLLVVECEKPSATLYEFNGFIRAPKNGEAYDKLVSELNSELNAALKSSRSGSKRNQDQSSNMTEQQQPSALQQPSESSTLADHASSSDPSKRLSIIQTIYRKIKRTRKSRQAARLAKITSQQLKSFGADHIISGASDDPELIEQQNHVEIPLDINNLLPRAARLRNTNYIYGLAVYTGRDTRLAHNSQVKPNKFSSLETRVNIYLMLAFMILFSFTFTSAIRYRKPTTFGAYMSDKNDTRHELSFGQILMAHFVLYNYLVPISLYVTLEFVKFLGTLSVIEDKKLQLPEDKIEPNKAGEVKQLAAPLNMSKDDQRSTKRQNQCKMIGAQCNSSDLNEDLGQVEVLFSDKTGTLTENKMRFMACSIGSRLFRLVSQNLYEQPEGFCSLPVSPVSKKLAGIRSNRYAALGLHLHARSSRGRSKSTLGGVANATGIQRSASSISSDRLNLLPPEQRPFDHRVLPPLNQLRFVESLEQNQRVAEFFICLCLCSTITLNEQSEISNCLPDKVDSYDLQSASPDEESLISAAAMFGIVMCKSSDRECYIAIKRSMASTGRHLSPGSPRLTRSSQQSRFKTRSPDISPSASEQQKRLDDLTGTFKPIVETQNSTDNYIVRHFERLLTFEFTSMRKKMSVLYRDCDNNCLLMITKGSENVLDSIKMTHLSKETELVIDSTLAHFEAFSKSGLRTMLVAKKQVSKQEYERIVEDQREARMISIAADREQQLTAISKQAEGDMQLIGTTAVEDSLQDGVPETIADLKRAGIKVWLLTGDKVETAISVAYLCKLLDRDMNLLYLVRQQDYRSCQELLISYQKQLKTIFNGAPDVGSRLATKSTTSLKRITSGGRKLHEQTHKDVVLDVDEELPRFALIADGRSLHYAMKHCRQEMIYICKRCTSVLGCRLSPLQKAEIVEMIKTSDEKPICAAIGDGANDVSMIQEAHVGIGLRGKEGRQAVNSSDFALNRFHMLNRLFFVHGHLFYCRTANTIQYFFYKNMLFVLPQFLYSFYNSGEATSLYHPVMLITYNLVFTSAPILLYGLFEVAIPEKLLEEHPKFYGINRKNSKMRYIVFFTWLMLGCSQALLAFYFLYYTYGNHTLFVESNKMATRIGFATVLFFAIVYAATIKLYLLSKNSGCLFHLAAILSCFSLPSIFYLISLFDLSKFFKDNSLYLEFVPLVKTYNFWLAILFTLVITIVPDLILFVVDKYSYNRTTKAIIESKTG